MIRKVKQNPEFAPQFFSILCFSCSPFWRCESSILERKEMNYAFSIRKKTLLIILESPWKWYFVSFSADRWGMDWVCGIWFHHQNEFTGWEWETSEQTEEERKPAFDKWTRGKFSEFLDFFPAHFPENLFSWTKKRSFCLFQWFLLVVYETICSPPTQKAFLTGLCR